ncbi:Replicative DNA helicase [Carnimonas sp. R-84981]|uniref:replicative DNA helicase n=1 Tax=Carnimonas bestiolae TaxID=3402172 RepID=UPI003EDBB593
MTRQLYSTEAEQSVIGAALLNSKVIDSLIGIISHADFYHLENAVIWSAIVELSTSGKRVDVITLNDLLEDRGQAKDCGGLAYIAEISRNTPTASNAEAYASVVAEKARLRRLMASLDQLHSEVVESNDTAANLVDTAQSRLLGIIDRNDSQGAVAIGEILGDMIDMLDRRFNGEESPMGVSFGLSELDKMTMGAKPGELIVIAGRPAMGKTAFMLNIIRSALKSGLPTLTFSMEMSKEALRDRMTAAVGDVFMQAIKDPQAYEHYLSNGGWDKIGAAVALLKSSSIVIDDRAALTPAQIRGACKRWKQKMGGLSLITIDYLQLMRPDIKSDNREQQVASMSRAMKELAKEMQCPVILLSQLNRGLENRSNKRPMMSDLRESGAIEQDADLILFPFREEVYQKDDQRLKGIAEIIIGKQREGATGSVVVGTELAKMQFNDLDYQKLQQLHDYSNDRPKGRSAMAEI